MKTEKNTGRAFLCVCLNPVIQKTLVFKTLRSGEVNRTATCRVDIAGKGICTTRILTQIGEKAVHLTQLGGPTRDWFLSMCADDALDVRWVDSGSPIRFCTTVIETDAGHATELVEEAVPVATGTGSRIFETFSALLPEIDVVMLSGTVAGGFENGLMGRLAEKAAQSGKKLYLDIKGKDLADCLVFRPVCVKPNLEELAASWGLGHEAVAAETDAIALVEKAGKDYFEKYGSMLVVTRGSQPTLYWDGKKSGSCPVDKVPVVNPIGSGDSFGAGLASALERGTALEEAIREGTRLGGLNAKGLKPGSIL